MKEIDRGRLRAALARICDTAIDLKETRLNSCDINSTLRSLRSLFWLSMALISIPSIAVWRRETRLTLVRTLVEVA